jgi:hypothetical protein
VLPILTRYEFWEREKFSAAENLNNESDPLENIENDANVNLIEFAFNLDPKEQDTLTKQIEIVEDQGVRYMQIGFPVRNNAPNLSYEIQRYFETTKEWKSDGVATVEVDARSPINPEFDTITLRLLDSVGDNDSALVRILVSYVE